MMSIETADRQLKSRQTLTELLERQIDRNQDLEVENMQLEEEQRRLLAIIQNKMEQIGRLQEGKPLSDSTFEMTMRDNVERSASLELIVREKETEIQKLRGYYTKVIEKIENEHRLEREQSQGEDSEKLKVALKKARDEIQGLQETLLRGNQKVRELSQELIVCEKELQELRRNEGQGVELKMQMMKLADQLRSMEQDSRENMLNQEMEYEQKLSKMKWDYQQLMSKAKREGEEKLRNLKNQSQQALKKLKNQHDERINFMIVRGQEQKLELRQQLQEEAKLCIMSELQQQQHYNKQKYSDMQAELSSAKQKLEHYGLNQQKIQREQAELEKTLKEMTENKEKNETAMKKMKMEVEEGRATVKKLEERLMTDRENSQYLEMTSRQAQEESKDLTDKLARVSNQNKRMQVSLKKVNAQNTQLKAANVELQNHKLSLDAELEEMKDKMEQAIVKNGREFEKKQKMITQLRKLAQEQEQQIQQLNSSLAQAQSIQSQSESHFKQELHNLRCEVQEKVSQNQSLQKENKKIKDEVQKLKQYVKTKFEEMTGLNEDLKAKTEQLQQNKINLAVERDNYRKLYEGNTVQLNRSREKIVKMEEKLGQIASKLSNSEQEIQYLKEEIGRYQLQELEKAELERLRDEAVDWRGRNAANMDQIQKLKKEGSDLARDVLVLHEENAKLANEVQKWEGKSNQWKSQKGRLDNEIRELQSQLEQRCKKMQSQMPYINNLIEEKKMVETELSRVSAQLKKKDHLLQKAKRSKAEELVSLQREGAELKKKEQKLEQVLQEHRCTLQKLNRQKVNLLRERTQREDIMRRIQKENRMLKEQIKKLQSTCDEQQVQIDSLYHMLQAYDKEDV